MPEYRATSRKTTWRGKRRFSIFAICECKNVEVVIVNKGQDTTFEEDLAKDVLEIITVFSARLYGSRSNKNKKLIATVQKAVEETQ